MALGQGKPADDALLFPTFEGRHWSPKDFTTSWSRTVKRLGMPRVTWHA
jgi:hypothetical protein